MNWGVVGKACIRYLRADLTARGAAVVVHIAAASTSVVLHGGSPPAGAAPLRGCLLSQLLGGFRVDLRDLLGAVRFAPLLPLVVPQFAQILWVTTHACQWSHQLAERIQL